MLLQLAESGKRIWVTIKKDIHFNHGFGHVWVLHEVGNVNICVQAFSQRIKDCYTNRWHVYIDDSLEAIPISFSSRYERLS